ncbi:12884_t:CDS:2 [Acaulospora colombiana]|uniref:12884_t:CDS:1 n=1 Tax=Acaulospora colombiana TaxID=27376 RepID=A0ACA9MK51_9GLOM|nr:12884_t:CDS:2 [Acaulospora colombiana]
MGELLIHASIMASVLYIALDGWQQTRIHWLFSVSSGLGTLPISLGTVNGIVAEWTRDGDKEKSYEANMNFEIRRLGHP